MNSHGYFITVGLDTSNSYLGSRLHKQLVSVILTIF